MAINLHPYLLLLLLPLLLLLFTFRRLRKPALKLPPGPPPLPFFGNLHILGEFPHLSLHHLSKKYGPLLQIYIGKIPTVITCDADTTSEVLKSQDQIFCSRTQLTALKHFTYGGKDLAFCPYDDHWKLVRRLCNAEVFNLGRIQSFHSFRREEVDALIDTISRASSRGEAMNFSEMVFCFVNNIMFREVFGKRVSPDGECEFSPFRGLLREVISATSSLGATDLFPFMGWVDWLTGWRRNMDKVFTKMDSMFEKEITERLRMRSEGKHGDHGNCNEVLLDALLNLRDDESENTSVVMNRVKGILMNMFIAGIDTSSTTIVWGMTQLMKNPEALKKAQEEVRRVVGDKGKVEETDLQHLHFLKMVIKETLRLHPPGPLLPPRLSMKHTKINGYDIPANTTVYVNVWSVGRDPKYWENPDIFWPERFMNSSVTFKGGNFELIPFGGGRRICPGIMLAMANMELAFANILYGFKWELPEGMNKDDIDMRPVPGMTTPKKVLLILVATPIIANNNGHDL